MKPAKAKLKKFQKKSKYPHLRSEGLAKKRSNGATKQLIKNYNYESRILLQGGVSS